MTTTVNNNENKVTVNRIGFSGLFSKFFKEDTQVYDYLFEGGKCYSFAYYIGLNDDCKNGLQESKESTANVTEISEKEKEFELLEADKGFFTGCSLGEVRACLNSKGLSVTIDKENESYFAFNVSDYTDDMIEVTGLDLESISSKVKQDSSKELKVIQDIKLYDKTGKIVFTYGDGNTNTIIETTFNGDSVLQSVLQKINESM